MALAVGVSGYSAWTFFLFLVAGNVEAVPMKAFVTPLVGVGPVSCHAGGAVRKFVARLLVPSLPERVSVGLAGLLRAPPEGWG